MTKHTLVDIAIAQTKFLELVERAHAGEEITIEQDGKALACLLPISKRKAGALKAFLPNDINDSALLEPMSEDELSLFE